jgi:hypothetical protein
MHVQHYPVAAVVQLLHGCCSMSLRPPWIGLASKKSTKSAVIATLAFVADRIMMIKCWSEWHER